MSTEVVELTRNFCPKCNTLDKNSNPLYCTKCGNTDLIPEPEEYISLEEEMPTKGIDFTKIKFDPKVGYQPIEVVEESKPPIPQIDPEIKEKLQQPFAFVTGMAGTGKSFLIRLMSEQDPSYIELTSTTGISAINLGGRTINSVLKYFNTKSLEDIYQNGKLQWALRRIRTSKRVLGIEEVSMLDARQLDFICAAVDEINNDGTGKQLGIHLIGDFLQLPAVKAELAFKSEFWDRFEKNTIHLKKIWRQENANFIKAMNFARAGDGNSCVAQLIDCGARFTKEADNNFDGTTLISLNLGVDAYNDQRLKQVISPMIRVLVKKQGLQSKEWDKLIPVELRLKLGAYVMILANDIQNFSYVNGDCGYVREYNPKTERFIIELVRNKKTVSIGRIMRENNSPNAPSSRNPYGGFTPYASRNSPGEWVIGNILYHPLRLAWASSVHKAQGLSLDKIQIDTRADFFSFPALAYVALSRARNAEGLVLVGDPSQIAKKIQTNREVRRWI